MSKLKRYSIGIPLLLTAISVTANDQHQGKLSMSGAIVTAACGIASDSVAQTVDFGQLPVRRLVAESNSRIADSGQQFVLRTTSCNGFSDGERLFSIQFSGTPSEYDPRLLQPGGEVNGVAIEFTSSKGEVISLDRSFNIKELMSEQGQLVFHASLRGFGQQVGAGEINAMAQISLSYF
ncbi:fimbrial protein [Enterobacter asburiae]|uniref:fimbrial protein n=1 Tax=Scandinavium sp. UTDF21-P1B TaxID=3446379 RepID=UPI0034757CF2